MDVDDQGDDIDITTGKVILDRGHLRGLERKDFYLQGELMGGDRKAEGAPPAPWGNRGLEVALTPPEETIPKAISVPAE